MALIISHFLVLFMIHNSSHAEQQFNLIKIISLLSTMHVKQRIRSRFEEEEMNPIVKNVRTQARELKAINIKSRKLCSECSPGCCYLLLLLGSSGYHVSCVFQIKPTQHYDSCRVQKMLGGAGCHQALSLPPSRIPRKKYKLINNSDLY